MITKTLHQICQEEKIKAMQRWQQSTGHHKHDANQAINAFDEILGQLYKHTAVKPDQFTKTKDTALRIANMIGDDDYKQLITQKINNL